MHGLDSPCAHGAHMAKMRPLHDAHQPAERCKSIWAKACQGAQPWVVVGPSQFCFCFSGPPPPRDRLFDLVSTAHLTSAARRCHVDDGCHPSRSVAARGEAASGGVRYRRRAVAALGRCAAVVAGRCG